MAGVNIPSKVLSKNTKIAHFLVKNVFLGILEEAVSPLCPSLARPVVFVLAMTLLYLQIAPLSFNLQQCTFPAIQCE